MLSLKRVKQIFFTVYVVGGSLNNLNSEKYIQFDKNDEIKACLSRSNMIQLAAAATIFTC